MTIEAGLYAKLVALDVVSDRVYPLLLPQNPTLPAITYQRVSGVRAHDLSGPAGLAQPVFQLDIWDTTYFSVEAVADSLRSALDGFTGLFGSTKVTGVTLQGDRDLYEGETRYFRRSMDFMITHPEA